MTRRVTDSSSDSSVFSWPSDGENRVSCTALIRKKGSEKTRSTRREAREERREPISQDSPPHFYDSVSGRHLFWANPRALKDGIATPHTTLAIHGLEDLFTPPVSGISEKTINLGKDGGPEELNISFKSGTRAIAYSAEDAVNVWVDFPPLILVHYILSGGSEGFFLKTEFHCPVVVEEGGKIDDEVSNDREVGEGFDEIGFSEETFDRCSAGQD